LAIDPAPADRAPAEPAPADPAPAEVRRFGIPRWILEVVQTVVLTLVIFVVIQNFVAQPFEVQQHSMDTTFSEGQYVLVDRLSHLWAPYGRGQVVVFRSPAELGRPEPLIKRIVAVGGDTVDVHNGKVFVNGTPLDEPYLFRGDDGVAQPTEPGSTSHWVVPDGDVFVLGDHREVSADSRVFGPIAVSSVIGRGILRYWPIGAISLVQTQTSLP
jgi:signal peptidase I